MWVEPTPNWELTHDEDTTLDQEPTLVSRDSSSSDGLLRQRKIKTVSTITSQGTEEPSPQERKSLSQQVIHSVLPSKGSVWASSLVLVKAALGTGILAIPTDSQRVGAGFMLGGLVWGAVMNVISLNFLGEACMKTRGWSFEDVTRKSMPGNKLIGRSMVVLTALMIFINCAGSMVSYCIIIADMLNILITRRDGTTIKLKGFLSDAGTDLGTFIMPFIVVFLLMPTSLAPSIQWLRYLATCGVFGLIFLMITLAYVIGRFGSDSSISNVGTIFSFHNNPDFYDFVNALSTVAFAFCNQYNMPQITHELVRRSDKRVNQVSLISTVMVVGWVLFVLSMFLGMIAFGVGPHVQDNLIKNFRQFTSGSGPRCNHRDAMVWVAMLLVILGVMIAYNFHVLPVRQSFRYVVAKYRKKDPNMLDINDRKVIMGASVVIVMLVIALAWDDFMNVVHYIGAIASSHS